MTSLAEAQAAYDLARDEVEQAEIALDAARDNAQHARELVESLTVAASLRSDEDEVDPHECCVEYGNGQVRHHHPPVDCDDECRESHAGYVAAGVTS